MNKIIINNDNTHKISKEISSKDIIRERFMHIAKSISAKSENMITYQEFSDIIGFSSRQHAYQFLNSNDKFFPYFNVFQHLYGIGIDLNWLLTGNGLPFRSNSNNSALSSE